LGTLTLSLGVSIDVNSEVVLAIVIAGVIGIAVLVMIPKVRRAIRPRLSRPPGSAGVADADEGAAAGRRQPRGAGLDGDDARHVSARLRRANVAGESV
jgi:hypothetical protein